MPPAIMIKANCQPAMFQIPSWPWPPTDNSKGARTGNRYIHIGTLHVHVHTQKVHIQTTYTVLYVYVFCI